MKRLPLVLVFLLVSGCFATKPRTSDGTTPAGRFATCTSDAIKSTAEHLQDDVASAVATADYKTSLANLAARVGIREVKCAVDLFIDSVTGRKANADPLAAEQLQRAQAWRDANP